MMAEASNAAASNPPSSRAAMALPPMFAQHDWPVPHWAALTHATAMFWLHSATGVQAPLKPVKQQVSPALGVHSVLAASGLHVIGASSGTLALASLLSLLFAGGLLLELHATATAAANPTAPTAKNTFRFCIAVTSS
jgi:hypothetical protein